MPPVLRQSHSAYPIKRLACIKHAHNATDCEPSVANPRQDEGCEVKLRRLPTASWKTGPLAIGLSGRDKGCECVGYQAHDAHGHEHPNMTMNDLVKSVRATGVLGVVGVFVPEDPKGPDKLAKEGAIAFDFGEFWSKGLSMGTGQAPVKAHNRHLCNLIHEGRAKPSFIISHELPLDEAPDAYKHFDARDEGWTKVALKPASAVRRTKKREAHTTV